MIHTKRVIFMILPLLFVPVVYGLSSTPDACAAPPDPNFGSASASCSTRKSPLTGIEKKICCWYVPDGETIRCQSCKVNDPNDCDEVVVAPLTLPGGAVGGPPTGGVFEQLPTTPAPPPLFGRNEGAVPPTGGIEQPFTSIPFQQIPQGTVQGQDQPFQGPGILQPLTTPTPLPTPPPSLPPPTQTGPTVAPQDSQDDDEVGGGGLPPIQNKENVPLGDTAEQPENEQPADDDGQNPTIIE